MQSELEFDFYDQQGNEAYNLADAVYMAAYFHCLRCGHQLRFTKKYEPVPLHYESLLQRCKPVTCQKCNAIHQHVFDEDDEEIVQLVDVHAVAPNQLSLF